MIFDAGLTRSRRRYLHLLEGQRLGAPVLMDAHCRNHGLTPCLDLEECGEIGRNVSQPDRWIKRPSSSLAGGALSLLAGGRHIEELDRASERHREIDVAAR